MDSLSPVRCENASLETCNVMNWLGYGPCIRKARIDAYSECDRLKTAVTYGVFRQVTSGSKAEGLTSALESDHDCMMIYSGVMCLEDGVSYSSLPHQITVFTLYTGTSYHGHCRLLLERRNSMISPFVSNALCKDGNGRIFLSSDLYVNLHCPGFDECPPNVVLCERAGPVIPLFTGALHSDMVFSLPCFCPSILQKWAGRRRYWPPPDVVHKVLTMESFVTPVGFKGSEFKHLEWRICFNTRENELVKSLNNTQTYLYVILKMAVKDVFKPRKKEITSYTVKNIVLWLAEKNPQELFNERRLLHWVHEGLNELKRAIFTEYQPYYMIPERNLMAACGLGEEQKRTWLADINGMLDEGPKIILRLPKVRQAIISHQDPLLWYSMERMKLELLHLKYMHRGAQIIAESGCIADNSDDTVLTIRTHALEIVFAVQERMSLEGSHLDDCLGIYIRMLK